MRHIRYVGARFRGAGDAPTGQPRKRNQPLPAKEEAGCCGRLARKGPCRAAAGHAAEQRPGGTTANIPHDPLSGHRLLPGEPPASPGIAIWEGTEPSDEGSAPLPERLKEVEEVEDVDDRVAVEVGVAKLAARGREVCAV